MQYHEIIQYLYSLKSEKNREGMARFGINSEKALGISMPIIREIAKKIKTNHAMAMQLWGSQIHEARILAGLIADSKQFSEELADKWVNDLSSWDICDQTCGNIFQKLSFRDKKIFEWAESEKEFIRRAAFSTIAYDAVHNKDRNDEEYISYFEIIKKYATDERNFVWKAVNWAIRQIGKRSKYLNIKAVELSNELLNQYPNDKTVRKICNDAIRELTNQKIIERIKR